jgi:carboxyl-terminal processing protease
MLKKSLEYFGFMNDLDRDDWFSVYISLRYALIRTLIILRQRKRAFDVSMSGKLGDRSTSSKEKLLKFQNSFQGGPAGKQRSRI